MRKNEELDHYLDSLRIKRRSQQLDDILLAIMLNKDKDIIEAIEESTIISETKKELIEWLSKGGINRGDYK
ncbi:hypothetical protein KAW50_07855 [candidate division WOR-3 bacterium]|nr:hypothetical protein [candidate division WOR-3 bacterium]